MRSTILMAIVLALVFIGLGHQQWRTYSEVLQLRSALQLTQQRLLAADTKLKESDKTAALARAACETKVAQLSNSEQRASKAEDALVKNGLGVRRYVYGENELPVKAGTLVMTTYATGGVREMLRNWVMHVRRLQSPLLVCAMDAAVVAQCSAQQFDCLDWSKNFGTGAHNAFGEYVRGNELGFRLLGVRKVDALLSILRQGIHLVLSDVDCVWSADPLPFVLGQRHGYESLANADMLIATDCMQPEQDFDGDGCFAAGVDKNTGIFAVRATADGIGAMAEWRVRLAMGQKNEQDQTTFMDMIDGNGRGHRWGLSGPQRTSWCKFAVDWCSERQGKLGALPAGSGGCHGSLHTGATRFAGASRVANTVAGSRKVMDVCLPNVSRAMKLGIFPTTEVAGGHTFFVQQYQLSTGRWPRAVHATYQFGDDSDYPFGKRQRFRDWGLWLADDEAEYVGSVANPIRYLVLDDDEPPERVAPTASDRTNPAQLLARGTQHVEHLEKTRQRIAHGVALARALNRTLVLPQLWCYCDKFWSRLSGCAIPEAASSQPLPFRCPMDHVVEPQWWHGQPAARNRRPRPGMLAARADGPWSDGMPFRGPYWLRQLGAHPAVGMSSARLSRKRTERPQGPVPRQLLQMAAERLPARRQGLQHEFEAASDGPRLVLPAERAPSDAELRSMLEPYQHVSLLRVAMSEAGGLLRCHERREDADDLQRLTNVLFQHTWCYRPQEMTAEWSRVERGPKPQRGKEPWCTWGFAQPKAQGVCAKE